ncbi:MAG: hypothetical protein HZB16_24060 [Armatimonadetes bacterium]|nr:hypothetical protein [Armatimonadota bacterium]
MALTLGAGGAWQRAGRALRARSLLLPLLLVQAPLMAVAIAAVAIALGVLVVSPLLTLGSLFAPGQVAAGHAVRLTEVERQRFAAALVGVALPWMLLQATWRAGLLAAADRQLRDGSAGFDDWCRGIAAWAPSMVARRVLALVVSLVLLLAALLTLTRLSQPGHLLWVPAFAAVVTLHLFWRRATTVQPAAMVAEDQDLLTALATGSAFGLAARGPMAQLGCLADIGRVGCVWPLALLAVSLVSRGLRDGVGPLGVVSAILVVGALAVALAWLDARRCVALLVLYRGRGGAENDAALATVGCRAARPAERRPVEAGLVVASEPDGARWWPQVVAGATPATLSDEPAL